MADSGPENAVSGIVEDVKGKVKEVAGTVTDNDSLREEGKAQQDKAEAGRAMAEHIMMVSDVALLRAAE